MVTHTWDPTYSRDGDGRITGQEQSDKDIQRLCLENKLKAKRLGSWLKW
jgi:hypothetical protein